jgi:hypothetical protein
VWGRRSVSVVLSVDKLASATKARGFPGREIFHTLCREANYVGSPQAASSMALSASLFVAAQRHSWPGLSSLPPLRHSF